MGQQLALEGQGKEMMLNTYPRHRGARQATWGEGVNGICIQPKQSLHPKERSVSVTHPTLSNSGSLLDTPNHPKNRLKGTNISEKRSFGSIRRDRNAQNPGGCNFSKWYVDLQGLTAKKVVFFGV